MKAMFTKTAVVLASTLALSGCMSSFGGLYGDDSGPVQTAPTARSGVIEVGEFNTSTMAPLQIQIEDLLARRGQIMDVEAAREWEQVLQQYGSYDGRFEVAVLTVMARNELEGNHRQAFYQVADRLCAHVDRFSVRHPETEFVLAMADVLSDGTHSCDKLDRSGRITQGLAELLATQ